MQLRRAESVLSFDELLENFGIFFSLFSYFCINETRRHRNDTSCPYRSVLDCPQTSDSTPWFLHIPPSGFIYIFFSSTMSNSYGKIFKHRGSSNADLSFLWTPCNWEGWLHIFYWCRNWNFSMFLFPVFFISVNMKSKRTKTTQVVIIWLCWSVFKRETF